MDTASNRNTATDSSRLSQELIDQYLETGAWRPIRLHDYLEQAALDHPDKTASVDNGPSGVRQMSYRDYADLARRTAAGLQQLGVRPGDVVSVMLPNCTEFGATIFAISQIGAVYSGIPVAYGLNEVAHMLDQAATRVLVVPATWGGRDFSVLAETLLDTRETLELVVVLGTGWGALRPDVIAYDDLVDSTHVASFARGSAGDLAHIGFTSGTTSSPKGVMNTHEMLDSVIRNWVTHVGGSPYIDSESVGLVVSPVGHHAGFLWGAVLMAYLGGTAVYMDRWDPARAAAMIAEHKVTTFLGAPTFLSDLLRVGAPPATWNTLQLVAVAGAPVPRSLVADARAHMGCFICPSWGMTEIGLGISASPAAPESKTEATDGTPIPGCEVRVVDETGAHVVGVEGALEVRGPSLFAGYIRHPEVAAAITSSGGWFDTGDRAIIDDEGFITISGRTKDLVIRGGENIPIAAVEDVLRQIPTVVEVAIIGVPDDRLGERACACVVTDPATFDIETMRTFLEAKGVSRHFWPERLEIFTDLPRTPSGKVKKAALRELISDDD